MDADSLFSGPFPELRTDRLLLRELKTTDADALFRQFSDDGVTAYYDLDTFTDPDQGEQLVAVWRQRQERGFGLRWAICRPDAPADLLGTCGVNLWIRQSARAVLGFDLSRQYWRQGIMSEALGRVLDFGFEQLEINRVEAVVFRDNAASCGLLEGLGFTREGLLREYEYLHGRFQDMYMFSLLRADRGA
ncbi:MAG TPA: GNAT family protein [Candidatus Latescibacteria bacterium]|nr:GNAT family protein [Candidatus Latescibacterota bacterium]HJP29410.1 GNAT family protein [Candidatus Latescibacterota bacterium]